MLIKLNADTFPVECNIPASLVPWVTHADSLTERLNAKAGNTHLEVLNHQWEKPNWWDKNVLHLDDSVLHREILMWAGEDVCWYARSIIPRATYEFDAPFFDRLEKESLSKLIFNEPKITRVFMKHYPISENSIEYHWLDPFVQHDAKELWVRKSEFSLNQTAPFFLIEIFLPAIERYSD
jgi:chorismate lyase